MRRFRISFRGPHLLATVATVACTLGLAFAPTASASATEWVPPEGSAIDQYRETLPGPGGNELTGGREKRPAKDVLGEEQTAKLEALGSDGQAAAELAAATDPTGGTRVASNRAGAGNAAEPGSGAGQIVGQATGLSDPAGGSGWLLALIIGLATVGAALYFIFSRRGAEK